MDNLVEMSLKILKELEYADNNIDPKTPEARDGVIQSEQHLASLWKIFYSQRALKQEPFIGYCKACISGEEKVVFICRNYTPTGLKPSSDNAIYLSYKAPLGALISYDIGETFEIETPSGTKEISLLEKDSFIPLHSKEWDAQDNIIMFKNITKKIRSLVTFLRSHNITSPTFTDKVDKIYQGNYRQGLPDIKSTHQTVGQTSSEIENKTKQDISFLFGIEQDRSAIQEEKSEYIDTPKTSALRNFELRDQAILDKQQDIVFRLPINSQVILAGAPGTGKTTVLIKRISQKTKYDFLTEQEKGLLNEELFQNVIGQEHGWVMYTPNELLRNYLKEALNKELLSATDRTVRAWDHEKINIARDVFHILKIGNKGYFKLSTEDLCANLENNELVSITKSYLTYCDDKAQQAKEKAFNFFRRFKDYLSSLSHDNRLYYDLVADRRTILKDEVAYPYIEVIRSCYKSLDTILQPPTNRPVKNIIDFGLLIGDFCTYCNVKRFLHKIVDDNEIRVGTQILLHYSDLLSDKFRQELAPNTHLNVQQHEVYAKRAFQDLLTRFIDHIDERNPLPPSLLPENGSDKGIRIEKEKFWFSISILGWIKAFSKQLETLTDMDNYIKNLAPTYQEFRTSVLANQRKELQIAIDRRALPKEDTTRTLSPTELDIILFAALGLCKELNRRMSSEAEKKVKSAIMAKLSRYYTYLTAIDEVTDFSTLQIGCMCYLADPKFNSITISGDLMQRVTSYGLRSWSELKFISAGFKLYELDNVYRLSNKLLKMASTLYSNIIGKSPNFRSPFNTNGDPSPLLYKTNSTTDLCSWLTERVLEIYTTYDFLPSIAIFVSSENDIDPLYEELTKHFFDNSIELERCKEGKILGQQSKVRIFSINNIKGLEFEAVFFVDIDKVDQIYPDLVDKFLYVGLTRSKNFVGITYERAIPQKIKCLEPFFTDNNWAGLNIANSF